MSQILKRYLPEIVTEKGLINLRDQQSLMYWLIDVDIQEGDFIVSGKRVFEVERHPSVPVNVSQPYYICANDPGRVRLKLKERENVVEGHRLYQCSEYSLSSLIAGYDYIQAQFLQNKGDVEQYLNSLFWDGELSSDNANLVYNWYNNWMFENHMKEINN